MNHTTDDAAAADADTADTSSSNIQWNMTSRSPSLDVSNATTTATELTNATVPVVAVTGNDFSQEETPRIPRKKYPRTKHISSSFAPSVSEYLHPTAPRMSHPYHDNDDVDLRLPRPEWCGLLGYLMKLQLDDVIHIYPFHLANAITMNTGDYEEHLHQVVTHHPSVRKCWIDHRFAVRVGRNLFGPFLYLHKDNESRYEYGSEEDTDSERSDDNDNDDDDDESRADANHCDGVDPDDTSSLQEAIDFLRKQLKSYVLYFNIHDFTWKPKRVRPGRSTKAGSTLNNGVETIPCQISFESLIQQRFHTKQGLDDCYNTILHLAIQQNATNVALDIIRMEYNTFLYCVRRDEEFQEYGMPLSLLETTNRIGVTPLILAAQMGNLPIVQALLRCGIKMCYSSSHRYTGSAMLQAAHLGRIPVMECLIEQYIRDNSSYDYISFDELMDTPNGNGTTPLMRAVQEGHFAAVQLLLKHEADVDNQNRYGMTALMVAAQRGYVAIVRLLIDHCADINLLTRKKSTALLLACVKGHDAIVKILVSAGCELYHTNCHHSTARTLVQCRIQRRLETPGGRSYTGPPVNDNQRLEDRDGGADKDDNDVYQISSLTDEKILRLLHPQIQVQLEQYSIRTLRNFEMIRMHALLQDNRADICLNDGSTYDVSTFLQVLSQSRTNTKTTTTMNITMVPYNPVSTRMLLHTMVLPAPLVQKIALFLPLPDLWDQQMNRLMALGDSNEAIICALDMMDEILESAGFLAACDAALIPPPSPHILWCDWKRCAKAQSAWDADIGNVNENISFNTIFTQRPRIVIASKPPSPQDEQNPTIRELRRLVGYTSLLREYESKTNIVTVLSENPYNIPRSIINQLIQLADVASICRRCCLGPFLPSCRDANLNADVLFDKNVMLGVIDLLRSLRDWYSEQCSME